MSWCQLKLQAKEWTQFETCIPGFSHLYYPHSALFIKWFLLELVKLILDLIPKSLGWSDFLCFFFFHLQNIAQLADWKAILAWLVSTTASQHCLCQVGWVVTGVSVAKYSFASLKREHLWHVENKICSSFNFLFAIISSLIVCACVYVELILQCVA